MNLFTLLNKIHHMSTCSAWDHCKRYQCVPMGPVKMNEGVNNHGKFDDKSNQFGRENKASHE